MSKILTTAYVLVHTHRGSCLVVRSSAPDNQCPKSTHNLSAWEIKHWNYKCCSLFCFTGTKLQQWQTKTIGKWTKVPAWMELGRLSSYMPQPFRHNLTSEKQLNYHHQDFFSSKNRDAARSFHKVGPGLLRRKRDPDPEHRECSKIAETRTRTCSPYGRHLIFSIRRTDSLSSCSAMSYSGENSTQTTMTEQIIVGKRLFSIYITSEFFTW